MSQTKVQLIAPIGVVTATTLETTGVLTATTFVGDIAGTVTGITSITDNLNLGIVTATSFAGDFTGIGSGLTGTPNVVAGVVTATKFVGNTPGTVSGIADGTNINAGIITATSFVGNLTGNAAGLSTTTAQLTLGIVTATSYSGSGANLSGVSAGPVAQQAVTANSSTTTIDLSSGNVIYMTQSANTTVAFANTEGNTDLVYLIRVKDATSTARTITWPSGFVWDGGTEPTLLNINSADEGQVFKLTTRDNGATWYGAEIYNNDSGKTLWAMGANYFGALGINEAHASLYSSPVQVSGSWRYASNGQANAIATKPDGTLWAWGSNAHGQLGDNSVVHKSSPVQIPGTTWNTTTNGTNHSVATKTDGTLWSWGYNTRGQLGHNNVTKYSSPVQVPGTTWGSGDQLSSGHDFVLSIKTDGSLWSWGSNSYGCLGHNNAHPTGTASSPVQVGSSTDWAMVRGSQTSAAAIKTDGTLWAWGMSSGGGAGQLGQNSVVDYSSPVQIPGTNWSKIIPSAPFTFTGLKTDGTLWAWGANTQGELGVNDKADRSSPVQIPGTWDNGVGSSYAAFWVKTDGTGWRWGRNEYGQLAQNDRTYRSSPIQIPGVWNNAKVQGRQNANFSLGMKA